MALFTILICLLGIWDLGVSNCSWTYWGRASDRHLNLKNVCYRGTCSIPFIKPEQLPIQLDRDINFLPALPRDLPKLQCIFALYNYLTCSLNEGICLASTYQRIESKSNVKQRLLIVLLLLLSGNVQPNPGPELQCPQTPSDFKSLSGLKYVHLNVHSLLPKMDMVRIWVKSTGADVVIISETWLSKSINNEDINIFGYNVYRTDRPKKGGGVAIYSTLNQDLIPLLFCPNQFANKWNFWP